jgi:hypothetical protein
MAMLIINVPQAGNCRRRWSVHMKHRQQHQSRVKAAPPSRPPCYTLIGIALVFVSAFLICWWRCSEALRKGFGA